jgi:single-strand DNA-binding protein
MALPRITATGNLTRDPDLTFTQSGIARCNIAVACNERKQDENGKWLDGETTYVDVVLWRQMAENACETLQKGDAVTVTGRLRTRTYEKDGDTRKITEVDADSVALDLRRSSAKVNRATRREATDGVSVDPWATPGAHDLADEIPPF